MSPGSDDVNLKAQLQRMLDAGIEPVTPARARGAIQASKRPGWQTASRWRTVTGLACACALTVALVLVIASRTPRHVTPPPAATSEVSGRLLISRSPGELEVISSKSGKLLRTIAVPPAPGAASAAGDPITALSVSESGRTIYLQRSNGLIERFAVGAKEANVVADGVDPVISPNGQKLAFLTTKDRLPSKVVVRNLKTGRSRSWLLPAPQASGTTSSQRHVRPKVISWAADSVHLAVTVAANLPFGAVEVIDTEHAAGRDNPKAHLAPTTHGGTIIWRLGFFRSPGDKLSAVAHVDTGAGASYNALIDIGPRPEAYSVVSRFARLPGEPAFPISVSPNGHAIAYVAQHITCAACQGPVADILHLVTSQRSRRLITGSEPADPAATAIAWLPRHWHG